MTAENTNAEAEALANTGATAENLNPGEVGGGNKAPPAPSNKPPEKKGDDEEHGTPLPKDDAAAKAKEAEAAKKKADEEAAANADESWKEKYIEFEDEAGRSVVNLLNEAGVKPVEANTFFAEALASGDFTKIRWDLIEARLGKDKAALAKIGITHHYETIYKRNAETVERGHAAVGGADNWKKVAAWVQKTEKADPRRKAEFDEIRKGIDAGGRLADYAFADLKKLYESDKSNSGLGVQKITQGTNTAEVVGGPLTRAQYVTELKAADARGARGPEIEAIRARRRAGMQAGI